MLQKMQNVLVIGPKKDFQAIVDVLYQAGTVHVEDVKDLLPAADYGIDEMAAKTGTAITELLVRINGILTVLPSIKPDTGKLALMLHETRTKPIEEICERSRNLIANLEVVTKELAKQKTDLELEIESLERYKRIMAKIQPLERQIPVLEGFEVTVLLIQKEHEQIIELIRPMLSAITKRQFELISSDIDETTVAAITVFNKQYSAEVHSFLFSKNVNEVRIPREYSNISLEEAIERIDDKEKHAKEVIKEINKKLAEYSIEWSQELQVMKIVLEDRSEEFGVYQKFGQTEYTGIINGWVPKKYIKATKKALHEAFGDTVVLTELSLESKDYEKAPSFYDNPRWVKPFEFFNSLVSPPKYYEIDPSPLFAIFFPLFFGIMVGDIGYGLCILAFALILKWRLGKTEWLNSISNILIICSIPTIFFGYLFGEFFGNFGEEMGWIEPVTFLGVTWNRAEAMVPLLILAIAIGVIHVFVGLSVGILNALAKRSKKHVCEKCGMIAILAGLLIIITSVLEVIPPVLFIPGLVIVIVAIPLIIYGGGILGVVEIMGTIGNVLSYARIMAIGLASVILALVANELGGAMGVLLVGILVATLLHALNIILAMFSPSIHSMRLHIVEFYSKFYEGGGRLYHPFKREG